MKFLVALGYLIVSVLAKNILLTNDDGFAATNIRATYYALKNAGHNVLLVAPVSQRSGWAGKFDIPYTDDLLTDGEFSYVTKGSPAWGHEDDDSNIWYFNGTPASCVAFGLRYVIPQYFTNTSNASANFDSVDLVVSGPNEGLNLSPGLFTISGTIGAAVHAAHRGLPSVAFSGSNSNNSFFKDALDDDPLEPFNIYADLVVDLVDKLFANQGDLDRVLPVGTGLNVNFPYVGYQDENCTKPEWIFSRLSGIESEALDIEYDASDDSISETETKFEALQVCNNGICALPSEAYILSNTTCKSSVSAFDVDADASEKLTTTINQILQPII